MDRNKLILVLGGLLIAGSLLGQSGSTGRSSVSATQSGTWTVQPGNTANTTAWKVDGSAVTQPISAASLPLPTGAAQDATLTGGTVKVKITGNAGANLDAATGAAPPANAILHAGLGSGATGGFMVGITVCDLYKPINASTAVSTLLVTGVASRQVRICSINLVTAGANNAGIIEGTGATCGTGTAGMTGGATAATGWNFAANGGIALGSGFGTIMQTATTGDSVCIITSAATQISGGIQYTIY